MSPSRALSTPPPQGCGPEAPGSRWKATQRRPGCVHAGVPVAHLSIISLQVCRTPAAVLERVLAPEPGSSDEVHGTVDASRLENTRATKIVPGPFLGGLGSPAGVRVFSSAVHPDVRGLDSTWLRQNDTYMDLRTVQPGTR